jgi:hypothetical protein
VGALPPFLPSLVLTSAGVVLGQSELRAVWGRCGREQQAAGRCLAGLRVTREPEAAQGGSKEQQLVYHFQPQGYSVLEGPLQEGDYVVREDGRTGMGKFRTVNPAWLDQARTVLVCL